MFEPYAVLSQLSELVGNAREDGFSTSETGNLCKRFCLFKEIEEYELSPEDVSILAIVWSMTFAEESKISSLEVMRNLKLTWEDHFEYINRIKLLLHKKILLTDRKNLNHYRIINSDLEFHPDFLSKILGDNEDSSKSIMPYSHNSEFMQDWLDVIELLNDAKFSMFEDYKTFQENISYMIDDCLEVEKQINRIAERINITEEHFPFAEMIGQYDFDENEIYILLELIWKELINSSCKVADLLKLISMDFPGLYLNRKYFNQDAKLVKNGLIVLMLTGNEEITMNTFVRINPNIEKKILTA